MPYPRSLCGKATPLHTQNGILLLNKSIGTHMYGVLKEQLNNMSTPGRKQVFTPSEIKYLEVLFTSEGT